MSYYPKKIKSLDDIKSGYVCMTRDGEMYMCLRQGQREFNKTLNNQKQTLYGDFYEKLDHSSIKSKDIVEVYGLSEHNPLEISSRGRPLLYKEPKKLTVDEISELLGYEVEIIGE